MAMNPLGRKLDKNGNPIIGKEELEKSGMSLREFLNKERGLKPRVRNEDLEPPHVDAEMGMTRGRNDYVTSGKKSFDTEREPVRLEPDMSNYKPRREPKPLTEVRKPGTNVNYESDETEMKRGGKVKASKMGSVKTAKPSMGSASRRGDGIAQRGKTKGRYL